MQPLPGRTDKAERLIAAAAPQIYRAFLDPLALVSWLPPDGMTGQILTFEAWAGGRYRMVLTYPESDHPRGKTSGDSDVVEGRFVQLVENQRVVQAIDFVSDDPAFAGTMLMTWSLAPSETGTLVSFVCENVPAGIRREDHDAGLQSTLANLAAYTEGKTGA
jgi:uncharacterized protein YndB with AHSA1/START domain